MGGNDRSTRAQVSSGSERIDPLELTRRSTPGAVFALVHRSRGLTRADITARTGLNRSTVAALVAELVDLGLVVESFDAAPRRVGRPSPLVSPNPNIAVLAVNPEVDAIELALVGLGAAVSQRVRREIPVPSPEAVASVVAEFLRDARTNSPERRLVGIGVAVPGLVSAPDGIVSWSPQLLWTDVPLGSILSEVAGVQTFVANDATLGATAEHHFGAGRDVDDVVYLNGTPSGLGGGIIIAGALARGSSGYAGEFGQTIPALVDPADRLVPNGRLEEEVSRRRIMDLINLASSDEDGLNEALAQTDDPEVDRELDRQRRILAANVANVINILNPSRIVLGGYLATLVTPRHESFVQLVGRSCVRETLDSADIVPAALGADRLLIGAAELALEDLLDDPAAVRSRFAGVAARA